MPTRVENLPGALKSRTFFDLYQLKASTLKAKKLLKYRVKTKLDALIKIMMDSELKKYNG